MFTVIRPFFDAEDSEYYYSEGDNYPRAGLTPSEKRTKQLSTTDNKMGVVFIEATEKPQPEKKKAEPKKATSKKTTKKSK